MPALAVFVLLALAVLVACAKGPVPSASDDARKSDAKATSVLLVTLDTTRADHLEPYGASGVETPALASLAERGVVFEQAWAVAPVTAPTHATLLTGYYPPRHGVHDNAIHYLSDDVPTLAERMSAAGLRTAAFVSAMVLERRFGFAQGFDLFDDDLAASGARSESRMIIERPAASTIDRAVRWLDGLGADEPFFLWVHLFDPHAPYAPPSPWAERFRDRPYDGEIASMDAELGRLLRHQRADSPDVIVVAVGDHGESLGEHGEKTHGLLVYESTLRVPWIMRLPGCPAGLRITAPVAQADLAPTLLDALGLSPGDGDGGFEGESLLPQLTGAEDGLERTLYAESFVPFYSYGWSRLRSVRQGPLKYIDGPSPELFDLAVDPAETNNLADHRPDDVRRLQAELYEWAESGRAESSLPAVDAHAAEQLGALGYIAGDANRPAETARGNPMELIGVHEEIQKAAELLEAGRFDVGVRTLETVLDRDPENVAALHSMTRGLIEMNRLEEADRVAGEARFLAPWSARAPMIQAEVAFRRGDIERALELADESLAIDPRYQDGRLERIRYLALLGRNTEAAEELEQLRELFGNSPWVDLRYVELVELPAGRFGPAEERLRLAVARDPFLADGWILLGEVLEQQARDADAAAAYRSGLLHRPQHQDLQTRLALLLAKRGDSQAEGALRSAIDSSPAPRADLHLALADYYEAHGRVAEARQEFLRAANAPAGSAAASNDRATAFARLGRFEEAASIWRAVVRDHPEFARAWQNLASIAIQRRQWAEAERLARGAVELDPEMGDAWNNLGIGLEELGRTAEAEAAYRRAVEIGDANSRTLFNLGLLLRKSGRYNEAADVQRQILARQPSHAGAHFELGAIYAGPLGDVERARIHLQAAIDADGNHPRAAQARAILARLP